MTIKQQGGVFGRNPSFNDVEANIVGAATSISSPLIDTLRLTDDGASGLRVYSKQSGGRGFVFASGVIYPSGNSGATNNNGTDLGSSGVRFKDIYTNNVNLASGGGIDFSATSGTGTSELFDDYEEGTFTASIGGFISDPSTPVTTTGYYTKIGRQVSISIAFNNVTTTGALGAVLIEGLPFTSTSEAISAIQISGTGSTPAVAHLGSAGTVIDLLNAVSYTNISHVAGAGKYFVLSITYFA